MRGDGRTALVVGAGIGGLAAALSLAQAGWRVEVFEQAHELGPVGAGLQISPNASRILSRLGVLDDVRRTAVAPAALIIRSGPSGRRLGGLDLGAEAERRWGAPFLVAHRGDLQGALLDAAARDRNITLHLGHRLEALAFPDEGVIATVSHLNVESRIPADMLIGADGLWSKTRGLIGLPGPASFSGCVAWRALVPTEAAPAFARELRSNLWLGPGAHLVHYPVRGGEQVNIVTIVEQNWRERGWSEPGDVDWIRARFDDWHAEAKALIAAADGWLRWSLFDRAPEPRWTRGAVALLGDAAHPMLPFMAQGAAQAIEDADALAAALREMANPQAALKSYEHRRLRRASRIQSLSRRQAFAYHASGPVALARDLVMSALGSGGLARRYDWIYGLDTA